MHKRIYGASLICLILILAGCGKTETMVDASPSFVVEEEKKEVLASTVEDGKKEPEKAVTFIAELDLDSPSITYVDGYTPDRIYASDLSEEEQNPFSIYDGYFSYVDDMGYGCNISIKNGFVCFETRGEKSVDITTEMYIEENQAGNHAYVELDGKIVQLGRRDMYTIEYVEKDQRIPNYLNDYGEAYAEMYELDVERIKNAEKSEAEAVAEELEALKKELEEAEAEEKAALEEEKKKEEEAAAKRATQGWIKGKVSRLDASEGMTEIVIAIIESNYPGLNAGDSITVGGDEWDDCPDDFGPLLMGYCDSGAAFEAVVDKHYCGSGNYRIVEFLG